MNVLRYELEIYHCNGGEVLVSETGDYVSHDDYADLEAKCAALAAENAGLKQNKPDLQTMMSALDAFFADEDVPERAMLEAYNILRGVVPTPATYAFRAELLAQGVELFAREMHADISEADAIEFAAQLRQEAAQ